MFFFSLTLEITVKFNHNLEITNVMTKSYLITWTNYKSRVKVRISGILQMSLLLIKWMFNSLIEEYYGSHK